MSNSKLATYRHITKNQSGKRTQKVSKITIHYMAAQWSGRQCADYFAGTGRQASSNYCVGLHGDIAVSVDEDCRAWTSSSEWNDQRSVTIECGNNPDSSLTQAGYAALIALCADICTRHGITPHYDGTANGSITMHKMFATTSCPGAWLTQKITSGQLEKDILAKMRAHTSANLGKYQKISGYIVIVYKGADGVVRHSKPSWASSTEKKGPSKLGDIIKVVGKQAVDGVYMYKLSNGEWITSSVAYVKYFTKISDAESLSKKLRSSTPSKKSIDTIAKEVIAGKWGNGSDRVSRLKKAGYDPVAVQKKVNALLS